MKIIRYILGFIFLFITITIVVLFTTSFGHGTRTTIAEMILSSQHRQWARYTFLPKEELDKILNDIQNPKYQNSIIIGKEPIEKEEKEGLNFANRDLVLNLETIKNDYGSGYFYEGKILEVSNPLNVKLVSSNLENHGEQIFVIADRVNAFAAINASGFVDANGRGNGGAATGVVVEKGEIKNKYGAEKDFVAGITKEGKMITGKYSGNELLELGVQYAAGFKPQLIVNGEKMIKDGDGGWGIGPRTAIGQKKDGTIVMVVIDGRQPNRSLGATLKEVQDIMFERGVINAMAMDGGSSSSMYFNGENITIPSSRNNIPRYLPNIWAVVPIEGQEVDLYIDGAKVN